MSGSSAVNFTIDDTQPVIQYSDVQGEGTDWVSRT